MADHDFETVSSETVYRGNILALRTDLVSTPGGSDEALRVYLAQGLTEVGRPEADDEEADMTVDWVGIQDAAQRVLAGDIVNSTAAVGIMAAYAVIVDGKPTRPVDAPWSDRPKAFAARKAGA